MRHQKKNEPIYLWAVKREDGGILVTTVRETKESAEYYRGIGESLVKLCITKVEEEQI